MYKKLDETYILPILFLKCSKLFRVVQHKKKSYWFFFNIKLSWKSVTNVIYSNTNSISDGQRINYMGSMII